MRAAIALALVAVLASCGATTKVVKVPVSVPCKVDMPQPPVWATESLKPDAGIFDQVKALLAERRQRQGYQQQLEAAIAACQPSATSESFPR